jgi:predicted AAA+ superfamily ATPase
MIKRELHKKILKALETMPVVALLGPRQVGKTTLALDVAKSISKKSTYLDLELDTDLAKLSDPEAYLRRFVSTAFLVRLF